MAKFDYAVWYQITATCVSPLRTGGTEGGGETVLTDGNHIPMIQGSSIAGVLRSAVRNRDPELEDALFGDRSTHTDSPVTVKDAFFNVENGMFGERMRVHMNPDTGCAHTEKVGKKMTGHLFETGYIIPGSVFRFDVLLKLRQKDEGLKSALERALADLNSGNISLGGQQSNGFGHVKLEAVCREFKMSDPEDRKAWISGQKPSKKLELDAIKSVRASFEVSGTLDSVLQKSGKSVKRDKKTVTVPMTSDRDETEYILSGSSIKGSVRNQCRRIAGYLHCEETEKKLFGYMGEGGDGKTDMGAAAKLCVHEAQLTDVEKPRVITRTRVSRFTGGVMESCLFSEQPVSGRVKIKVDAKTEQADELGLLFLGLRDLAMGIYNLGSEEGVGRGFLTNGTLRVCLDNQDCEFSYKEGKATANGSADFIQSWIDALNEKGGTAQ